MVGWMDGWTNEWRDRVIERGLATRWMDGWTNEWGDRAMVRERVGRLDGWMDGRINGEIE